MWTIRNEQLQILENYLATRFENRIEKYLRQHFPLKIQSLSPAELKSLIELGRNRAFQYAINEPETIERFIGLMLMHGENFDKDHRWARAILRSNDKNALEKLDLLAERALEGFDRASHS